MIGRTLSHFRITAKLGEGGMGEVWRAEDTKLGREVAIKVLPSDFVEDPERLARFEREAKVLASLNHQNIAGIYEVGSSPQSGEAGPSLPSSRAEGRSAGVERSRDDGEGSLHSEASGLSGRDDRAPDVHYLVMELVEGPTLDERLQQGPMPLDEAIPLALQIAEALEEAHEKGVIHRDLKPQNIKLTETGQVKVLDFGLAKALDPDDPASGSSPRSVQLSHSPTMTLGATMEGVILGTAAYMSPEQAKGQAADKRADIWAFGVVLKEMLTGERLFDAPTAPETLAQVLTATETSAELPESMPPALARLVERCLVREPRDRLRDIGDARLELEAARGEVAAGISGVTAVEETAPPAASRWSRVLPWAIAVLALVAFAGSQLDNVPEPMSSPRAVRFPITFDEGHRLAYIDEPILAFSPDGSSLAFVARDPVSNQQMIYIRALESTEARAVAGTEGGASPAFSPDGRHLAFFADDELHRVPIEGGRRSRLAAAASSRGVVWESDSSLIFSPEYATGLERVSADGGPTESIVAPAEGSDERTYRWPDVFPGGRTALYTIGYNNSPNDYSNAKIALVDLETGESSVLLDDASMARFVSEDRIIYGSEGRLFSIGLDLGSLSTVGSPVPVIDGVGGDPSSGTVFFALAATGDLAYLPGSFTGTRSHLVVLDRDGNELIPDIPGPLVTTPRFSPDGETLVFVQGTMANNTGDVWTYSLADGAMNRMSFETGGAASPVFTPDGRSIAYLRGRHGIVRRPADGTGEAELISNLNDTDTFRLPSSFSADGQTMAFTRVGSSQPNIYLQRLGEQEVLFESDASAPMISPDGRFVAFSSPGSGQTTVVVRPVEGEGRWQVPVGQGGYPRWSKGGRELFYIDISKASRPLMKVSIDPGDPFRASPPEMVIDDIGYRFVTVTAPVTNWDVNSDGDYFVFTQLDRDDSERDRIELVLNWGATLGDG